MLEAHIGLLEKLKIQAYKDSTYNDKVVEEGMYEVLFNPTQYMQKYEVEYDDTQASGTSGTNLKFNKIIPQEFTLELVFDNTLNNFESVPSQIRKFIKVLNYNGEIHSPAFVKLTWGSFCFKGRIKTFEVNYTLFNNHGKPLRAKGNAAFLSSIEDRERESEENSSSPDLTHVRVVKEGDTLPLLCYQIYGKTTPYQFVARHNRLINYRRLKPGTKIYFPPLTGNWYE